jgi:hypothetical protein
MARNFGVPQQISSSYRPRWWLLLAVTFIMVGIIEVATHLHHWWIFRRLLGPASAEIDDLRRCDTLSNAVGGLAITALVGADDDPNGAISFTFH